MRWKLPVALTAVWCLGVLLGGCTQVPFIGRTQIMLIGAQQEIQLGNEAWQQVLAKEKIHTNPKANEILQRVGRRIVAKAEMTHLDWDFKLFSSDQVNAFALPGGKVAVYVGILPVCENEAGLAAVVGHEVGHVLARHGAERISHGLVVQMAAKGLEAAMRDKNPAVRQRVMGAYGLGTQYGVLLPYSRKHEREADRIGMRLMAEAGYDPAEAPRLWQRMKERQGGGGFEFLSTHPAPASRIAELQSLLPEMNVRYENASGKYGVGVKWVQSGQE